MSQRKAKEQKRAERELADQRKEQRRNRFWRMGLLVGGIALLGTVGYFALHGPAKKIYIQHKTYNQGEINVREGENVRAARKLVMTAPLYKDNPLMTYHAALNLLNSSGIVAKSLAHRGIDRVPDISALLRPKPELEPFLVTFNNGTQGNTYRFEFDLRVVPLVQLLDLIVNGDGYVRVLDKDKLLAFSDLLVRSRVELGYDPMYETYSTSEVFKRGSFACGDMTIMLGTIIYIWGGKFIPIYAFPFFDSGDGKNEIQQIHGVGHAILGLPFENGVMIFDPSQREITSEVKYYFTSSTIAKLWFDEAKKQKLKPPVSQWPNASLRFALMVMPPASEVQKTMAENLLQNEDSLAFEQQGGLPHFMFLKRKAAVEMLNDNHKLEEILSTVKYVESGMKIPD